MVTMMSYVIVCFVVVTVLVVMVADFNVMVADFVVMVADHEAWSCHYVFIIIYRRCIGTVTQ